MGSHAWQWLALVAGAAVAVVAAVSASDVQLFDTPIQQPFPFNHKKHIEKDWTCPACHVYVDQEAFASIPTAEDCVTCHESEKVPKPDTDAEKIHQLEELRQLAEQGGDIPWDQVYRVPDHVFFSHRRHVAIGGLKCVVCHGDMTQMTEPVTRQAVKMDMDWCIDCHEEPERNASVDCLACHR